MVKRFVKINISDQLTGQQKKQIVETTKVFNTCTEEFLGYCQDEQRIDHVAKDYYGVVCTNNPKALTRLVEGAGYLAERIMRVYEKKDPENVWDYDFTLNTRGYGVNRELISFRDGVCSLATTDGRIQFECELPKGYEKLYHDKMFKKGHVLCAGNSKNRNFWLALAFD